MKGAGSPQGHPEGHQGCRQVRHSESLATGRTGGCGWGWCSPRFRRLDGGMAGVLGEGQGGRDGLG